MSAEHKVDAVKGADWIRMHNDTVYALQIREGIQHKHDDCVNNWNHKYFMKTKCLVMVGV